MSKKEKPISRIGLLRAEREQSHKFEHSFLGDALAIDATIFSDVRRDLIRINFEVIVNKQSPDWPSLPRNRSLSQSYVLFEYM